MEDLYLDEICRLCLIKHTNMQSAMEVGAIDRLLDCASVELPSDSLICEFCKEEVEKWYSFKQQVLKSLEVAKYIERHRKERSVLDDNYILVEECFVKTEVDNHFEEVDVKPDISQIDEIVSQEQTEEVHPPKANTYKCDICNKTLHSLTGFINHKRKIHSNKTKAQISSPKSMDECQEIKLEESEEINSDENKYQCDLCHKSFISKMGMMWHKQLHSALKLDSSKGTTLFSCPHCPMSYEKKLSLIDHMKWKHQMLKRTSQFNICDFCGKFCKSKNEFRIHMKRHKAEKKLLNQQKLLAIGTTFSCAQCGRCFGRRSGLVIHQATHERTYKCHTCNKAFGKKYMLKNHMGSH